MAYDISIEDEAKRSRAATSFDEFYAANIETISAALYLAAGNGQVGAKATSAAFARAAQRWKVISAHRAPAAWTYAMGVAQIEAATHDQPSRHVDEATGGYVHGLTLVAAIDELPLQQRAALAATYFLEWPDDVAAAGANEPVATIATRRRRALRFLGQHLGVEPSAVEQLVAVHFAGAVSRRQSILPSVGDIARRGRRRGLRNRVVIGALVLAAIGVGGGLVSLTQRTAQEASGPPTVDPPSAGTHWFGPVSDGAGGFVALDSSRGSRFISSAGGHDWYRTALWNSRAVDLRSEVTGFWRSGGRYLATIEPAAAAASFVPPHVAVSDNLADWDVRAVDVGLLPEIDGLRPTVQVLSVAATRSSILVAVGVGTVVDYRSLGVAENDVCAEVDDDTGLALHLCDGTTVQVSRTASTSRSALGSPIRFFLSEGSASFVEVAPPDRADPYGLFSFGEQFAMLDSVTGRVLTSPDGRSWSERFAPETPSRFVLAEGSTPGETMLITPAEAGWQSMLFEGGATVATSELPIDLAPASIWIKPELASGPAGWALFVTTSRPWERADAIRGWAVDTGDWIVSRAPDSIVVSARTPDGGASVQYRVDGRHVIEGADGEITLLRPGTDEPLVRVTQAQIDRSRQSDPSGQDRSEAQVFFSEDGERWRVIWESTEDTWDGTVAVGDAEVLLSGSQLIGGPISIPLG